MSEPGTIHLRLHFDARMAPLGDTKGRITAVQVGLSGINAADHAADIRNAVADGGGTVIRGNAYAPGLIVYVETVNVEGEAE